MRMMNETTDMMIAMKNYNPATGLLILIASQQESEQARLKQVCSSLRNFFLRTDS